MEFTIYSVGSAVFLEEILNSVAMISGSGDIESLAKIGLAVGTLILAFQAVFNGTGIQFQKLLVCMVMYLAMYGPSGRALIEDVYTGDVAVVDNVPLGPLAVGSMVSTIGYNITNIFEQAFSTPSMTNYGFADPLNTLVQVRLTAKNVFNLGSMSGSGNESLLASWSNYMRECTLTAANNDDRALTQILKKPDAIEGLRFDSNVYYTKIYDGSADGVTVTCTQAYATLTAQQASKQDELLEDIAKSWARPGATMTGADLEGRMNNALFAIAGGAVDARNFAVTAALLPILEGAPGQQAISDMQGAAAIMMSQAAQQQATQWAAEGSMFTKYIRPFMTFFEGFIYAITPLMAFVIVLGGFGISLVSKYLMLLVWMMLWLPVLAIVNLYTISTTKAKIMALLGADAFGATGISFANMREMLPVLEAQIGVAGMMASAVPALCMFLVYGTSVAASGIASRLGGSDTINEKISSPDVVSPGAGLSMGAQTTHDSTRGSRQTGSEELRPTMNVGASLEKARQSASENLQSSSEQYTQAFQKQIAQSVGQSNSLGQTADLGKKVANSSGLSNDASYVSARQQALSKGYSEEDINAFTAQTAGGLDAKLGMAGTGGSLGTKLSGSNQQSNKSSVSRGEQDKIESGLRNSINNSFSKENSQATAERLATSQDFGSSSQYADALSKQTADLNQSKEAYSNVEAFKSSYGMSSSVSLDALANDSLKNGTAGRLQGNLDMLEGKDRDEAHNRASEFTKAHSGTMGNEKASVAGAAYALGSMGRYDLIGDAIGSDFEKVDPDRNAGINHVGDNGNEGAYNARGIPSPTFNPADERSRIEAEGGSAVLAAQKDGTAQTNAVHDKNIDESAGYRAEEIKSRLSDMGKGTDYDKIMGSTMNMPAWAARAGNNMGKDEPLLDAKLQQGRENAAAYGLPPELQEISARAEVGYLSQGDMATAVTDLQKNHGLDRNEALGAVEATVTGTYSRNKDGGKGFDDLKELFNEKAYTEPLKSGPAPETDILKLND